MQITKKIANLFKRKSIEYGGLELIARLTSGAWSKTKMLEQYEKSLYVYACVYKIAEKVATSDLLLYQILNSNGDTKEVHNHDLLNLLYKPNPFQTKSEFLKITMINKKLCGDAFWYKVRSDRGKVVELWNLRPDFITIIKDKDKFIKAYELNKKDGTKELFAPEDIVHFKYPTPLDDYFGTSPVKSASTRIETEGLASSYQRDFFLNNARPDAAIKTAGNLTPAQKEEMRDSFKERHQGKGKNSKLAIFEGGLEYQQLSISQREMDYIESMKFTRDDILVAFGVPKAIVSITDDVNRANAETSMYIFLSETVKPELEMLTEKITEGLVIPDFGDNLYIGYPDPTPENREQTIKEYESGLKEGYYLINEVRAKENLQPVDGGWALYKPLNMLPVGELPKKLQSKSIDDWQKAQDSKAREKKLKIFRGRDLLYAKLKLKEKIIREFKKVFTAKEDSKQKIKKVVGEKSKTEKELVPLIKTDLREDYANMIIKQIDRRADKFKIAITNIADKQHDELINKLSKITGLKSKGVLDKNIKGVAEEAEVVVKTFYKGQEKVFAEFSLPFIDEFVRYAGIEAMGLVNPDKGFIMTEAINKAIKVRATEFGLGINKTTREKVSKAIADGLAEGEGMVKISDRINVAYKEFPTWRSDMIARTESTAANNEGFIEAYKQSDVATHKEWIATMDGRTREEHYAMDGEIVKIGRSFSNGLQYPQEPNCRCVIGPAFEK